MALANDDILTTDTKVKASSFFDELIKNINSKYIIISYNNMGEKGAGRSQAKLSDKDIITALEKKGKVKIFEKDFKFFNAGKTQDIEELHQYAEGNFAAEDR